MRFKVPQNVQREDQILWFLTLSQVIILIVGFGISYMLYSSLSKTYELNQIDHILIWLPFGISAGFAFLRIKGITLFKFILLVLEQFLFRPIRRHWMARAGDPFVSMTMPFSWQKEKAPAPREKFKEVPREKIKNLAAVLDGEKVAPKKVSPLKK